MEVRDTVKHATLLVLTANRGLCGGYNGNVVRAGLAPLAAAEGRQCRTAAWKSSGKKGIAAFKFRSIPADVTFTHFEDKPTFDEVDVLASRYLDDYATGKLDRLDVVYTKFESIARQQVAVETLLPLAALGSEPAEQAATTGDEWPPVDLRVLSRRRRASWRKSCPPASR